jgi:tetratricopeptide (TPR) repeat protein
MRNPSPGAPTTWSAHKEQGKRHWNASQYEEALASYRAALASDSCPAAEKQILLSNIIACRLKIGGAVQAAVAVEEAKQCVAINESWAKGHVRLASAYIALGDHSNDACNSLQRAISLDPGNTQARQMLMRELRRDHIAARESSSTTTSNNNMNSSTRSASTPVPTAPLEEELDEPILEESMSWNDRFKLYYMQGIMWWESQTDDRKNLIKVGVVLIALYVAFGGRFGLDQLFSGNRHEHRGNYEAGNAYDRYYNRQQQNYDQRQAYETEYEYRPRQQQHHHHHRGSSFHLPNLFDGSPQSMVCLAGIAYLSYKAGINPFQVIMMMNMMAGGRRRGMGMHRGMGMGYGGGMGGMGYGGGFGGRRGFGRNRWR